MMNLFYYGQNLFITNITYFFRSDKFFDLSNTINDFTPPLTDLFRFKIEG